MSNPKGGRLMIESEEHGFVADLPDFAATDDLLTDIASRTPHRRAVRRWSAGATVVLVALLLVVSFPRQIGAAWGAIWSRFANHPVAAATAVIGTFPSGATGSLAAGSWQTIVLPRSQMNLLALAPVPQSGGASLACASLAPKGKEAPGAPNPPLTLWRSTPAGTAWQQLPLPQIAANECALSVAPDAPNRVALMARTTGDAQGGCATEQIWLSDDGGTAWRQVPHASVVAATPAVIACAFWATAHHLFLTTTYQGDSGWRTLCERSNDALTWQRVKDPFGDTAWFDAAPVGMGDSMLATTARTVNHIAIVTAWASQDAGQTWHAFTSPAPLSYLVVSSATANAIPSPLAPIYAVGQDGGDAVHLQDHLLQTTDGREWDRLPALPIAGLGAGQTGILRNVGVLANGDMVVLGADPHQAAPVDGATLPSLWVWAWQPFAAQWNVTAAPVPGAAATACCLGTQAALAPDVNPLLRTEGTFLWVWSPSPLTGALYRLFLPDVSTQGSGTLGPTPQ
jgi:hypothetical protein